MNLKEKYQNLADQAIDSSKLSKDPKDRLAAPARRLLKEEYVIDVHVHFFDIQCINKCYFVKRFLKDQYSRLVRGKGFAPTGIPDNSDMQENVYIEGWEEELLKELQVLDDPNKAELIGIRSPLRYLKAAKFLSMDKMELVYQDYIENYSIAKCLGLAPKNVLTTALMMDLQKGWGVDVKKNIRKRMDELKRLSKTRPILPFFFCDPRRADDKEDNLYELFHEAFCEGQSFFGVKIYPSLGYDPYDVRLWPIYQLCEEYNIPVLTHCGGVTITAELDRMSGYHGETAQKMVIKDAESDPDDKTTKKIDVKDRKDGGNKLNDPKRWQPVMKKFPGLRLNIAHFGGYETWDSDHRPDTDEDLLKRKGVIIDLMEKYEHVYADFSYNIVEDGFTRNLKATLLQNKRVRERTMFGSDYWMVMQEGDLYKQQMEFKGIIRDNDLINELFLTNPYRYLFGN